MATSPMSVSSHFQRLELATWAAAGGRRASRSPSAPSPSLPPPPLQQHQRQQQQRRGRSPRSLSSPASVSAAFDACLAGTARTHTVLAEQAILTAEFQRIVRQLRNDDAGQQGSGATATRHSRQQHQQQQEEALEALARLVESLLEGGSAVAENYRIGVLDALEGTILPSFQAYWSRRAGAAATAVRGRSLSSLSSSYNIYPFSTVASSAPAAATAVGQRSSRSPLSIHNNDGDDDDDDASGAAVPPSPMRVAYDRTVRVSGQLDEIMNLQHTALLSVRAVVARLLQHDPTSIGGIGSVEVSVPLGVEELSKYTSQVTDLGGSSRQLLSELESRLRALCDPDPYGGEDDPYPRAIESTAAAGGSQSYFSSAAAAGGGVARAASASPLRERSASLANTTGGGGSRLSVSPLTAVKPQQQEEQQQRRAMASVSPLQEETGSSGGGGGVARSLDREDCRGSSTGHGGADRSGLSSPPLTVAPLGDATVLCDDGGVSPMVVVSPPTEARPRRRRSVSCTSEERSASPLSMPTLSGSVSRGGSEEPSAALSLMADLQRAAATATTTTTDDGIDGGAFYCSREKDSGSGPSSVDAAPFVWRSRSREQQHQQQYAQPPPPPPPASVFHQALSSATAADGRDSPTWPSPSRSPLSPYAASSARASIEESPPNDPPPLCTGALGQGSSAAATAAGTSYRTSIFHLHDSSSDGSGSHASEFDSDDEDASEGSSNSITAASTASGSKLTLRYSTGTRGSGGEGGVRASYELCHPPSHSGGGAAAGVSASVTAADVVDARDALIAELQHQLRERRARQPQPSGAAKHTTAASAIDATACTVPPHQLHWVCEQQQRHAQGLEDGQARLLAELQERLEGLRAEQARMRRRLMPGAKHDGRGRGKRSSFRRRRGATTTSSSSSGGNSSDEDSDHSNSPNSIKDTIGVHRRRQRERQEQRWARLVADLEGETQAAQEQLEAERGRARRLQHDNLRLKRHLADLECRLHSGGGGGGGYEDEDGQQQHQSRQHQSHIAALRRLAEHERSIGKGSRSSSVYRCSGVEGEQDGGEDSDYPSARATAATTAAGSSTSSSHHRGLSRASAVATASDTATASAIPNQCAQQQQQQQQVWAPSPARGLSPVQRHRLELLQRLQAASYSSPSPSSASHNPTAEQPTTRERTASMMTVDGGTPPQYRSAAFNNRFSGRGNSEKLPSLERGEHHDSDDDNDGMGESPSVHVGVNSEHDGSRLLGVDDGGDALDANPEYDDDDDRVYTSITDAQRVILDARRLLAHVRLTGGNVDSNSSAVMPNAIEGETYRGGMAAAAASSSSLMATATHQRSSLAPPPRFPSGSNANTNSHSNGRDRGISGSCGRDQSSRSIELSDEDEDDGAGEDGLSFIDARLYNPHSSSGGGGMELLGLTPLDLSPCEAVSYSTTKRQRPQQQQQQQPSSRMASSSPPPQQVASDAALENATAERRRLFDPFASVERGRHSRRSGAVVSPPLPAHHHDDNGGNGAVDASTSPIACRPPAASTGGGGSFSTGHVARHSGGDEAGEYFTSVRPRSISNPRQQQQCPSSSASVREGRRERTVRIITPGTSPEKTMQASSELGHPYRQRQQQQHQEQQQQRFAQQPILVSSGPARPATNATTSDNRSSIINSSARVNDSRTHSGHEGGGSSRCLPPVPLPPFDPRRRAREALLSELRHEADLLLAEHGAVASRAAQLAAKRQELAAALALERRAAGEEASTLRRLSTDPSSSRKSKGGNTTTTTTGPTTQNAPAVAHVRASVAAHQQRLQRLAQLMLKLQRAEGVLDGKRAEAEERLAGVHVRMEGLEEGIF